MQKRYNFISDGGHGWIEVPMSDVYKLGLANKISSYSYRHGDIAYLEEDSDASLFVDTAKQNDWKLFFHRRDVGSQWCGRTEYYRYFS
jgi:hypothetical protein